MKLKRKKSKVDSKSPKNKLAKFLHVKYTRYRLFSKLLFALGIGDISRIRYDLGRWSVRLSDEEQIKLNKTFLKLSKSKQWKKFGKEAKSTFIHTFMGYGSNFIEDPHIILSNALEFAESLLSLIDNENWDKLTDDEQSMVIRKFSHHLRWGLPENSDQGKKYMELVFRLIENDVDFSGLHNVNTVDLLQALVRKYKQVVLEGEFNSLTNIQEMLRDLVLLDVDNDFFNNSEKIFKEISRDQFAVLCARLSEERSDLVQRVGEKLFESRGTP